MKLFNTLLILSVLSSYTFAKDKIFVVERESSSLATIEDGLPKSHIKNMHNLNHGVVKFKDQDGYLISRDGYVVKFNPITEKKEAEYKTSKSAIGFVIGKNYVAVANYDDKSVDILSRNLKPLQKIKTGSRNVGIKIYKNYIVFAQMDNDTITVLKNITPKSNKPHFKIFKQFKNVGKMPFDAMIKDNNYIVGFFLSKHFGVLNLNNMTFKKIKIKSDHNKIVLKVPHFGFWAIGGNKIFIPAVGDNKVLVYDNNFNFIKNIDVQGTPVFTSLSPKKDYLAVTFSGKNFPYIEIIDTKTLKIIKKYHFDGKVLHVRWSNSEPKLYVSVNDSNKVVVIDTNTWRINREIYQIQHPSGIFIYQTKDK